MLRREWWPAGRSLRWASARCRQGRHVDTGRWRRVLPGVYATFTGPISAHGRVWAALLYAGRDAAASHGTALWLWELTDEAPAVIDVVVPESRRVLAQPGCAHPSAKRARPNRCTADDPSGGAAAPGPVGAGAARRVRRHLGRRCHRPGAPGNATAADDRGPVAQQHQSARSSSMAEPPPRRPAAGGSRGCLAAGTRISARRRVPSSAAGRVAQRPRGWTQRPILVPGRQICAVAGGDRTRRA